MIILRFIGVYYTLLFVWGSCAAAFFAIRGKAPLNYRLFAWLIILLSVVETASNIIAYNNLKNHFLFNISEPILFFGVAWFFYSNLKNKVIRKIIRGFLWIFPVVVLVNNIWIQGFYTLNTGSYIFGGSFILLLSIAYLWQLYIIDETGSIFRDPVFWISIGYFFYCAISVPYIGMLNYLWNSYPGFTRQYYIRIYDVTIVIYRVFLILGFLCMRVSTKQN